MSTGGDFLEEVRKGLPSLVKADNDRNVGMPMELICVENYARMAGVTPEEYIIQVLRAERDRRQEQDSIVRDRLMLDERIDQARAQGMGVLESVACHLSNMKPEHRLLTVPGTFRAVDISKHFMIQLIHRLEERLNETLAPVTEGEEA